MKRSNRRRGERDLVQCVRSSPEIPTAHSNNADLVIVSPRTAFTSKPLTQAVSHSLTQTYMESFLPVLFHDVLKRPQKVFLEPEVGQLPFLQKLHGQLPEGVHGENRHVFVGITADLNRFNIFKKCPNGFTVSLRTDKCSFSETKWFFSFQKTCPLKNKHLGALKQHLTRRKRNLKIYFPTR